ncbi:cyclic nucleotide-binding domain-containing protein [Synechococcus elongatus]|nr:cyclic nucleotide-binding domain-containing protein [Synechococcus elongatus]WKW04942.1 cyclic nucleotide-binding domain-containing protein [Synechococcus elongatus PCC 7942 = FACHB-805]
MPRIRPAEIVEAWQKHGEPLLVPAGSVIFNAEEQGTTMYGLLEGEVVLKRGDQELERITAGDVFGEGAIAQDQHQRFSTAVAATDCKLATLDRERFLFLIHNSPVFALDVIASLSTRLRAIKGSLEPSQ